MPVSHAFRTIIPMTVSCLSLLACLACLSATSTVQAHAAVAGQCGLSGLDHSGVLPDAMFNVRLPPFGDVCFVGRQTLVPDDPDHSTVIGFELWHDGTRVYRLPRPDGGLWPPACDGIRAVAFPARGDRKDIVVIGNCLGASDEQPQPLVYRAGADGFTLDADLSTDLIGVGTVEKVEQRMRKKIPQG